MQGVTVRLYYCNSHQNVPINQKSSGIKLATWPDAAAGTRYLWRRPPATRGTVGGSTAHRAIGSPEMPLKDEVSCPYFTTPNRRRDREAAKSGCRLRTCLPVLFVRMKQLGSHWTDVDEIWYLSIFGKSLEEIEVSSQADNSDAYFICSRPIYVH